MYSLYFKFETENRNMKKKILTVISAFMAAFMMSDKLSAGGYTFIPIDSLAVFGNYTWNGSSRTIDLIPY